MKHVWFKNYLGHVQHVFGDGSVEAWFHDSIGGAGYVLRLWHGEWKAA